MAIRTPMQVYVLWDDTDGYRTVRAYKNMKSAEFALQEHYSEMWRYGNRAKVYEVTAYCYSDDVDVSNLPDEVLVLWDENDGCSMNRVYVDDNSAKIALQEHYTDFWIHNNKAKIKKIPLVSYV